MSQTELYIGLMSGTSIDGIDAALVAINGNQCELIAHHLEPMSPALVAGLHQLCAPSDNEIAQQAAIEVSLTDAFSSACSNLLRVANIDVSAIKAIGSHGQTIRHYPERGFTLQIGDANRLAVLTGIDTIADFRRKDMALGGQGAPLVPAFHQAVFQTTQIDRAIINIGGLSNITFLPADQTQTVIGYDTGPGNTLLDAWFKQHGQANKSYDEDGLWASQGKIYQPLLNQLLKDEYLAILPPKSTGRERYNLAWLDTQLASIYNQFKAEVDARDVQRTLIEFTAFTIADEVKKLMPHGEVYICGGGAANPLLMQSLTKNMSAYRVSSTQDIGIHPDWVEAIAFAWLAKQHVHQLPGNLPAVTGASRQAVLGSFYPWR